MKWLPNPFRSKRFNPRLSVTINTQGQWVFDNDNRDDSYIKNGYKELPNVYGLISAILKKSTIVPFEVYKVKSLANEKKYKSWMDAGNNPNSIKTKKLKDDSYDQIYGSDIEKLLLNPNDYQTLEELWWEIDGYKLLTGNSYTYMMRLGSKIKELHSIASPFVSLKVKGTPFDPIKSYGISYLEEILTEEDILHFKNWSPVMSSQSPNKQFLGQSPLQACRMLLGRYKDADLTQGFMFKNQGPGGLLTGEKDNDLTQEQAIEIQDRFRQQHQGTHKANDIIVTPNKMSWTSIGLSPVDLNIIPGKLEMLEELCNAYNYPAELFMSDKKFNNYEQARRAAITDAVIPLVESRKQTLNKYLAPHFGPDIRIEFDYSIFYELQDDLEKQSKIASTMFWTSPNEKRELTGYDRLELDGMDDILIPSGLSKLEDVTGDLNDIDPDKLDPTYGEVNP